VTHCSTAGFFVTTVIPVVDVARVIRSVCYRLCLGGFRRNTFVLLPLQESMTQGCAAKNDQWRGYITVLVFNHENIISISIVAAVIHAMTKFDLYQPRYHFCQGLK